MRFEFATATRIIFGPGTLKEIGPVARELGRRAFVVTGREVGRAQRLLALLAAENVSTTLFSVPQEPTLALATEGTKLARESGCDLVISLGGGSVIDGGKAIAALLANEGDLLDYVEVIGRGQPLRKASVPFIAIPTTAGAGAEVTRNAVLSSPEKQVKVSLRSALMLPRVALVDPELTYDLPPALSAATGLDALTQLIEPYTCARANPLTDSLCVDGMRRAARSLRAVCERPLRPAAREDMCVASLFGGLALANAGLGAAHGFAAPIGGQFPAPHGAVCAALLPHVMEVNCRALRSRAAGSEALQRYDEVARLLTAQPTATADDGIRWVKDLVRDLGIPPLRTYGVAGHQLDELITKAQQASSMKANPIALQPDELLEIIQAAL